MVLCTFHLLFKHPFSHILVFQIFLNIFWQQSCKIFVELNLQILTIGASHRNIQSQGSLAIRITQSYKRKNTFNHDLDFYFFNLTIIKTGLSVSFRLFASFSSSFFFSEYLGVAFLNSTLFTWD